MTRDEMKKEAWVVVLADGHDYSGLDGAWIAMTSPEVVAVLDESEPVEDQDLTRIEMQALLEWAIDQGFFDDGSAHLSTVARRRTIAD